MELLIDEVALYRIEIDSEKINEIGEVARQRTRDVARLFMSH